MAQLFTNGASALLQSSLASGDTSLTLGSGAGDLFPSPDPADANSFALCTLEDTLGNYEIVKLTDRTGDLLTIERGQESTTPLGFAAGDRIECRLTAGSLANFQQVSDIWGLRGAPIQSDAIQLWHATDPASYQYFDIRYTLNDIFGVNMLSLSAPVGVPDLGVGLALTGPGGEQRVLNFNAALSTNAPSPATNEVQLQVPGVLSFSNLSNPYTSSVMYQTWDTQIGTDSVAYSRMKWEADDTGTGLVSYKFICRNEGGVEKGITFQNTGNLLLDASLFIRLDGYESYANSDSFRITHTPSPSDPESTDWTVQAAAQRLQGQRRHEHVWFTREVDDVDAETPVVTERRIRFKRSGNVEVQVDPVEDNDLVRKSYIDGLLGTDGTQSVTANVLGRTVLWTGSLLPTAGGSGIETLNQAYTDFYQIMIVSVDDDGRFVRHTTLDTASINGGSQYALGNNGVAPAGAADISIVFASTTTFNAWLFTETSSADSGAIQRVIGLFPK